MSETDKFKDCPIEIIPAANGFIVYQNLKTTADGKPTTQVFQTMAELILFIDRHFSFRCSLAVRDVRPVEEKTFSPENSR